MDDDIISQGGSREPRPWPRRLTVLAALAVLVVCGGAYLTFAPRQQSPLAWDRDLRLPVAGTRPAWLSPASGRADPIGGLPASRAGYQFTRVVGGWAVQASSAGPARCGSCAPPPEPVWFLADGARSATPIGTASLVAPGATAGAVWLTSYPVGANMLTVSGTAREAGATGTPPRAVRLPPGYAVDQGTVRGLLLAPVSLQVDGTDVLWNLSAPASSPVFAGVLAVSPDAIAWTSPCATGCVEVLNLATGKRTEVTLPPRSLAVNAAFSPDGSFLALQLSLGSPGDGAELGMQLQVAPVASGRLTPVPGTWVSSDALAGFGWPTADDALVAKFSFTTKTQLASWHPGASRSAVTVIAPGSNEASLILG